MTLRVFITGGASGLGRALAESYAREGARILLGDIHEKRLEEAVAALKAAGAAEAHALPTDVRRQEDMDAAAAWMASRWGGADVVMLNAGVAVGGGIEEVPLEDWQWILDVNVLGVVRGAKAFAPMLRRQKAGHLVATASMAGLIHPPMMSAYNASKAAVVAIAETLRFELAPDDVRVSVACPSFFRTNLTETMRGTPTALAVTQRLVDRSRIGADEIAREIRKGMARGDFHLLTHAEGRKAWALKRYAPFGVYSAQMIKRTRGMMGKRA